MAVLRWLMRVSGSVREGSLLRRRASLRFSCRLAVCRRWAILGIAAVRVSVRQ